MKEVFAFLTAFLGSFFSVPFVLKFAKRFGLITDKRKRKHPAHTHKGKIPRAGGLAIFFGVIFASFLFLPFTKIFLAIHFASLILLIIGLLDDKYDLSPYLRFFLNILAASIAVAGGIGIPYVSNPFGGVIDLTKFSFQIEFFGQRNILWLSDFLAIFWLVFTTNVINWSKGVDGQMPGFVSIAAFFLGILAYRFSAFDVSVESTAIFAFIVSGAFLGFLPWNFYPQKIMPGYSGGALAGFYLGVLSLLSFGKLGTAIMILAVPLIDGVYTIVRRLAGGRSPFLADWGHFHHRLLEIGWGRRRIAVFYWTITFLFGFSSLFITGIRRLAALFSIFFLMAVFFVFIEKVKAQN